MKVKTLFIVICIISLMGTVSCTETSQKKEEVSVKNAKLKKEQKQIAKGSSSTSKTSKKSISEFPPPPPSVDKDHRNYFIPPLSEDDVVEIREQQGDNFGVELSEPPKEDRYSNENPEPVRPNDDIINIVDEPAEFPGGNEAMKIFLKNNLVYPPIAIEMNLQGKCYVQFTVNIDGTISNVKIKRDVPDCPECDKEAIRVIKKMPKWHPGKLNGKVVGSYYNLPIAFKMI